MNDATFFWTKSKDVKSNQLFAAGNLRFKQQAILVDGYNSVDVDLINLDSENLHEKPEKKPIPDSEIDRVNEMHNTLVEIAAENEEGLMEKYFEEG